MNNDMDSDDFTERWQSIIADTEIQSIPLKLVKTVKVLLVDGSERLFDVKTRISEGLTEKSISKQVESFIEEFGDEVDELDFEIDIPAVATLVTKKTEKLLK